MMNLIADPYATAERPAGPAAVPNHGGEAMADSSDTNSVQRAGVGRASRSAVIRSLKQLPKEWQLLAMCESSNRIDAVSPSGDHYGLWQLHRGFFTTLGLKAEGSTFAEQWRVAQYAYDRQGARAWTCAKKAGLK